jgi:hypothetical protein
MTVLKWIFKKLDVKAWTEFICLWIGASGEFL